MPTAADGMGLSPGAQALKNDRGFGGVRGGHASAPGGGAGVPAESGFEAGCFSSVHVILCRPPDNVPVLCFGSKKN